MSPANDLLPDLPFYDYQFLEDEPARELFKELPFIRHSLRRLHRMPTRDRLASCAPLMLRNAASIDKRALTRQITTCAWKL